MINIQKIKDEAFKEAIEELKEEHKQDIKLLEKLKEVENKK